MVGSVGIYILLQSFQFSYLRKRRKYLQVILIFLKLVAETRQKSKENKLDIKMAMYLYGKCEAIVIIFIGKNVSGQQLFVGNLRKP